jgi:hypothetical protein
VNSIDSILRLLRNGVRWLDTRWRLADIYARRRAGVGREHRGDFMHPDIPRLVIAERELRP